MITPDAGGPIVWTFLFSALTGSGLLLNSALCTAQCSGSMQLGEQTQQCHCSTKYCAMAAS